MDHSRTIVLTIPSSIPTAVLNSLNTDGMPRKRKRLDNLTQEERCLRRKLKNRVAAQTARDRKKARMTELEEIVGQLESENEAFRIENGDLVDHVNSLQDENTELRNRLGLSPPGSPSGVITSLTPVASPQTVEQVMIKTEPESLEHASLFVSLPQKPQLILGLSLIMACMMTNYSLTSFLACLTTLPVKTLLNFSQSKKTDQCAHAEEVLSSKNLAPIKKSHQPPTTKTWGREQNSWSPLMKS